MIITESELAQSTDVFPIKFLGIQRYHEILYGKNVMEGLEIKTTHLRLRCEQELKNLAMRLRQQYLYRANFFDSLATTLIQARATLLDNLGTLAELKNNEIPDSFEVMKLAEGWGLEVGVLDEIKTLEPGGTPKLKLSEIRIIYGRFMMCTDKAAALADQL